MQSLRSCTPLLVGSWWVTSHRLIWLGAICSHSGPIPGIFPPSSSRLHCSCHTRFDPRQSPFSLHCWGMGNLLPRKPLSAFRSHFIVKYFTQRATHSTTGVAGVDFGVNEVLVVAGYFRDEGTCDFKCLQTEKIWACLFCIFNRGSDARDIYLLLYSPDFCLTTENNFQGVWGWLKYFVLYFRFFLKPTGSYA